ncbi:MAG: GAF domain-containing protein, partial [Anaerolinea sp.]|nr:GAF domain-containing protein [Anaerolinea sp.]
MRRQLPWLAGFGLAYAGVDWIDMFLVSGLSIDVVGILQILRVILQPLSGLLLLRFGWGMLTQMTPLPDWARIIPGIAVVPLAFVLTYAATTFVTPSPIGIPIDIWSRYLLYLPGSIMAAIGFLRQRNEYHRKGLHDLSRLMLGAGVAFLAEAMVVGLIVPAAPYGPVSYYDYDRVLINSAPVDQVANAAPFTMIPWLDYARVLEFTGLPVQFWRMLSALAMIFFVVRSLGVFDATERRRVEKLQAERDRAQSMARHVAERWTDALVTISRRIAELDSMDNVLLDIVREAQSLLNSDFVAIGLLDNDGQQLTLIAYADSREGAVCLQPNQRVPVQTPLILETMRTAMPYCSDEVEQPEAIAGLCHSASGKACAAAIVPLLLDNFAMGALWSARFTPTSYTSTDLIGLERLADQAVIAIQHRLMATKLQSLAVVDERGRIAREMHDGLAQILGYLNLQVQTLEALLKQGKQDNLLTELQQMR